jgi:hypothetical protein
MAEWTPLKPITSWIYQNDIYRAQLTLSAEGGAHIAIQRIDMAKILRDWEHFQQIKNELLGEDCEAIEFYPAQDEMFNFTNTYHLYGWPDPSIRLSHLVRAKCLLVP